MELNGRNLSVRMKGEDVRLLQTELHELGYIIDENERNKTYFGVDTRKVVESFQRKQGLSVTGVVDQGMMILMNNLLEDALHKPLTVTGTVKDHNGEAFADTIVKVVDKDLRHEELLGEVLTNDQGEYQLNYSVDQFARAEKDSADLIVRVLDDHQTILTESDLAMNVPKKVNIDLLVKEQPARALLSEFEKLIIELTPLLEGIPLSDLNNDHDIPFLQRESGEPKEHIILLAKSAQLNEESGLPTEVFYGWGRKGIALKLPSILDTDIATLNKKLLIAIEQNIIPELSEDSFAELFKQFEALRIEENLDSVYRLIGTLLDEQAGTPLAGLVVNAFDANDSSADPVELGYEISNAEGNFGLTFVAPSRKTDPNGNPVGPKHYKLNLKISTTSATNSVIIHKLQVEAELGKEVLIEIKVPIKPEPDTTETIDKLASTINLAIPQELKQHLLDKGMESLADIRHLGGIVNSDALPATSDKQIIEVLDAHASLSAVSDHIELNQKLINDKITTPVDIAQLTRAEFVSRYHKDVGDIKAAQIHHTALINNQYLNQLTLGFAGDVANGFDTPITTTLAKKANIFQPKCKCENCESAVSPSAYLADLINYCVVHLRTKVNNNSFNLIQLGEFLHQPFAEIPIACDQPINTISQARLCIEVLRRFVGDRPLPDNAIEAVLVKAEKDYAVAAYESLLSVLGTNYETLRNIRTANDEDRERLALRLGLKVDDLNLLILDPDSTNDDDLISENNLERLFGLPDTRRDVFSTGAKTGDTVPEQLTRWVFHNVEWNRNTDSVGQIYLSLTQPDANTFRVEVFRDANRLLTVASGEIGTAIGSVILEAENDSGLTGTIELSYVNETNIIELAVVPEILSRQFVVLRQQWLEQDHSPTFHSKPIIDPDLIGPVDLMHLGDGAPAYELWQARREQVDSFLADARDTREADNIAAAIVVMTVRSLPILQDLRAKEEAGEDITDDADFINLELKSFHRLLDLAALDENNEPLLASELNEIDSILAQVRKVEQFSTWITEEVDEQINLGTDYFKQATEEPVSLPLWRATQKQRRQWRKRLTSRIEQEESLITNLQNAVQSSEIENLTSLRDELIIASDTEGDELESQAKWINRNFYIDSQANACHQTTRIAQALETLQGLLWSIRSGNEGERFSGVIIDADNFSEEWKWLGTYETWRSAMFVYIYPENILLPSLRKKQTPAFKQLVKDIRKKPRLTPQQACHAARNYEEYLQDIYSLQVEAACQADTFSRKDNECESRNSGVKRHLNYVFGRGLVSNSVYWSSTDYRVECSAYPQTFWEKVPNISHAISIIGASPYQRDLDERFICLFIRSKDHEQQQLLLTRYNLETQRWDDEPTPLELPNGIRSFTAVILQQRSEDRPVVAIRLPNGAIYTRSLNVEATDWDSDDVDDNAERDDGWFILVPAMKGREFKSLLSYVEVKNGQSYMLVQDRRGNIRYRFFGNNGNGYWEESDSSRNSSNFIGAFVINSSLVLFSSNSNSGPQYQRINTQAANNLIDRDGREIGIWFLNYWLEEVAGFSLQSTVFDIPGYESMNALNFLSLDKDNFKNYYPGFNNFDVSINERKYIIMSEKLFELLEAGIASNEEEWADWSYANAQVRRFFKGGITLVEVLRSFHKKRFEDKDTNLEISWSNSTHTFGGQSSLSLSRILESSGITKVNDKVLTASQHTKNQSDEGTYFSVFSIDKDAPKKLIEGSRLRLVPRKGPSDITNQFTDDERKLRKSQIKKVFGVNSDAKETILTYLYEAYYFVPIHLALQLQRRGQYMAALDWFRSVYDYSLPKNKRKIYYGLVAEESLTKVLKRQNDWLGDPLNPHAVASTRANTYTRFTLFSIIRCLLAFADAEFTRDTSESVAHARALYEMVIQLLDNDVTKQQLNICNDKLLELEDNINDNDDPDWSPVWDDIKVSLDSIKDAGVLEVVNKKLSDTLISDKPLADRMIASKKLVLSHLNIHAARPMLGENMEKRLNKTKKIQTALYGIPNISDFIGAQKVCQLDGWDGTLKIAANLTNSINPDPKLPWLREPKALASTVSLSGTDIRLNPNLHSIRNLVSPSHMEVTEAILFESPLEAMSLNSNNTAAFVPIVTGEFCVPPNPYILTLRFQAEVNLYKIQTCRNISGDERDLEPYSTDIDITSGLPTIGSNGQVQLARSLPLNPTPYRYQTLIDRAKQLVSQAQQIESSFISALEKRDAEYYNLIKARQDVRLTQAGVKLQDMRVREAGHGVKLSELQKERSEIQLDHFDDLLEEGFIAHEQQTLALMTTTAVFHTIASSTTGVSDLWDSGASAFSSLAALSSTLASIAQFYASHERRKQEWGLQSNLAKQDIKIGNQQIKLSKDRVEIVDKERSIAKLQSEHASATAEFLANKFTNAELYEWMSEILEGVYSFFLQTATTTGQLAANQLAFERQQLSPPIIQSDYWEAPLGTDLGNSTNGSEIDRRGLTGSARLLQDIYQLDQYAFETDERKLQLTKTLSLGQLMPAEFQRFRETGVLRFGTPLNLFDHDFPGHYLRLIKRIRTSVIALIPPLSGIKATLSTTGLSRVVLNANGTFQIVDSRRTPESIALSSARDATGQFELIPQLNDKLYPFEGMGVDSTWELSIPKAANPFNFDTIADVFITIEYTALADDIYRDQIIRSLDRTINAERPFSFRQDLADLWYELNNPIDISAATETVSFNITREEFPPNILDESLTISNIVIFFSSKVNEVIEVNDVTLSFTRIGNVIPISAIASTINGVISTRQGTNASEYQALINNSPIGKWELTVPMQTVKQIKDEKITDILFVINYEGNTPEWPA